MKWPGAIQVHKALNYVLINNCISGSEKIGIITAGVPCSDMNATERICNNEVRSKHFLYKHLVKYVAIYKQYLTL